MYLRHLTDILMNQRQMKLFTNAVQLMLMANLKSKKMKAI